MSDGGNIRDDDDPYLHGEEKREYRAVWFAARSQFVCFIPASGNYDRERPIHDLRASWIRKDGREIRYDFSDVTIILTGRRLHGVALAMRRGNVTALETYNEAHHHEPEPGKPVIETMEFFRREGPEKNPEEDAGEKGLIRLDVTAH